MRFECVSDGRCDYDVCCSGSDEWQDVGGISCPDKCKQIDVEWKKAVDLRQKSLSKATKKRKELQASADRLKEIYQQLLGLREVVLGNSILTH